LASALVLVTPAVAGSADDTFVSYDTGTFQ